MSDKEQKKPRLKGFAKFVSTAVDAAKNTKECKEFIKGVKTRVLLNNKEDKWAALVTIKNDQIIVEGVRNEPKKNLKRDNLYWWGYWEIPNLQTIMKSSTWKTGKWLRKMARGKVKGASQIGIVGQILGIGFRAAAAKKNE